jgi:hypothetical protein
MRSVPFLVATLLIAFTGGLGAQDLLVDTMRMNRPWGERELYTFPLVRMPDDASTALRINRDLQLELLSVDPDTSEGRWFDLVWGDSAGQVYPPLSSISWSWSRPVQGVLSVEFSAEACGAYCEGFTNHYAYDVKYGRRIRYEELFMDSGATHIAEVLDHRWREIVGEHITILEADIAGDQDDTEDRVQLYRSCLDERTVNSPHVEDMEVLSGAIRFTIARCSSHAELGMDELDAVAIELPRSELEEWLLPEMRSVFGW